MNLSVVCVGGVAPPLSLLPHKISAMMEENEVKVPSMVEDTEGTVSEDMLRKHGNGRFKLLD